MTNARSRWANFEEEANGTKDCFSGVTISGDLERVSKAKKESDESRDLFGTTTERAIKGIGTLRTRLQNIYIWSWAAPERLGLDQVAPYIFRLIKGIATLHTALQNICI